jgi:hypothetical protein
MSDKLKKIIILMAVVVIIMTLSAASKSGARPVDSEPQVAPSGRQVGQSSTQPERVNRQHKSSETMGSIPYPPPIIDPYPAPYPAPTLSETDQWKAACEAQGGTVVEVRPDVWECVKSIPTNPPLPTAAPTCDPLDPSCG